MTKEEMSLLRERFSTKRTDGGRPLSILLDRHEVINRLLDEIENYQLNERIDRKIAEKELRERKVFDYLTDVDY